MRRNFFLVLFIAVLIGIQPVFAQSGSDGGGAPSPAKKAVPEKAAKETEVVININLASDSEFTQALETASDVELVDEDNANSEGKAK